MTAQIAYIVKQYEEHNMGIEDICDENPELEILSVKSVLMQYSAKYRADTKDPAADQDCMAFSDDEAAQAKSAIVSILQTTDDDYLKLRCAKRIIDEKKGRLDVERDLKQLNIISNLVEFNATIKRLAAARDKTNEMRSVIEIEPKKVA